MASDFEGFVIHGANHGFPIWSGKGCKMFLFLKMCRALKTRIVLRFTSVNNSENHWNFGTCHLHYILYILAK